MNRYDNLASTSVNFLRHFFSAPGKKIAAWINNVGNASILAYSTIVSIFKRPFGFPLILKQFDAIGVNSLAVVLITGVFTGMVLALQAYYQLAELAVEGMAGRVVCISVTKELGPIITAFVLAGRIGSAVTAELGTMKVTEQIDAEYGCQPCKVSRSATFHSLRYHVACFDCFFNSLWFDRWICDSCAFIRNEWQLFYQSNTQFSLPQRHFDRAG